MNNFASISIPGNYARFLGYIPEPTILPSEGGKVASSDLTSNDVLSGRGKRFNNHVGNVQFRKIVNQHKNKYYDKSNKKIEKAFIAARVVATVRCLNPPGRFLKRVKNMDLWEEIGDIEARRKASQAFRKKQSSDIERKKVPDQEDVRLHKNECTPTLDLTLNYSQQKNSDLLRTGNETGRELPVKPFLRGSSSEKIERRACTTTDAPSLANFQFKVQGMSSVGPLSYSALRSYCDKSVNSVDSTYCSDLMSDLMSDSLDFEIDVPGIGEDTLDNFPLDCSKSSSKASLGILYPQVNPITPFRRLSLFSAETENLVGIRVNSNDTFSQTSFERWSSSLANDFLESTGTNSQRPLFVW